MVSVRVCVLNVAEIVTFVLNRTRTVETWKLATRVPVRTVTVAGTLAMPGELDARLTLAPGAFAGPLICTQLGACWPPKHCVGVTFRISKNGVATVIATERVTPFALALIVTGVLFCTAIV
jgi:hypothetical protein